MAKNPEHTTRPLRIVSLISRRPCCVGCTSIGIVLACVGVFGLGIIVGYMPARIDFSPDSFTVTGDAVADRHRAFQAARQRSSSLSPMRLGEALSYSPPSRPPSPPSAPLPPQAPPAPQAPPDPPASPRDEPGPGETWFEFEELAYLNLYVKLDEASPLTDGLFDAAVVPRIKSLQDRLFQLPQLSLLCRGDSRIGPINGTRPSGNCTMPHGVVRLLYAAQSTTARFNDLSIPLPSYFVTALSTAVPPAVAASRIGGATGRVNSSALLERLTTAGYSLSAMGAPTTVTQLLARPTLTCATFGLVGSALSATDCGPVAECCACGEEAAASGCANLPLCQTSDDGTELEYRNAWGESIEASEAPLSGAAVAAEVASEIQCTGSSLRDGLGWATTLDYRNGTTSRLTQLRTWMQLGTYRAEGQDWASYYETVTANWDTLSPLINTEIVPLVKAFNDDPANVALGLSAAAWSRSDLMVTYEIISHMISSSVWAALGTVVMMLYLVLHLRSPMLAYGGLFGVVLAFPFTWFVYTGIFRIELMGFFNFMGCFILVGIGVDDIFVFADAWEQSRAVSTTLEGRMQYAYRRSIHAMAITSVTDAAAFYANVFSAIPIVRLFGIFMGTAVLLNFALVCTWFPALVAIRHRAKLDHTGKCCPSCLACWGCYGASAQTIPPSTSSSADPPPSADAPSSASAPDAPAAELAKLSGLAAFFGGPYLRVLHKLRWLVVLFALALVSVSSYSITRMEPTDRDFRQVRSRSDLPTVSPLPDRVSLTVAPLPDRVSLTVTSGRTPSTRSPTSSACSTRSRTTRRRNRR